MTIKIEAGRKERMKPSKTAVGGGGGRRNWLTGGKENERVPALPKEVEKEKTSNRAPESFSDLSEKRDCVVSVSSPL